MRWTLVQHSGYSVGGNPQFQRAVEERDINGEEAEVVLSSGGWVFDSYAEANNVSHATNYPPEAMGLIPEIRGDFSDQTVQGMRIYLPEKGAHRPSPDPHRPWAVWS